MPRSQGAGAASGRDRGEHKESTHPSRRDILRLGLGGIGLAGAGIAAAIGGGGLAPGIPPGAADSGHDGHRAQGADGAFAMPTVRGEVNHVANGFDPGDMLTDFDGGKVSTLPSGQTLHEYSVVAQEKWIEVVPGSASRRGPTTDGCRARASGCVRATACGSSSSTPPHIRTACTSTESI